MINLILLCFVKLQIQTMTKLNKTQRLGKKSK